MRQLFECHIGPHVYQGSFRTLLTQEGFVEELVGRGVQFQCHHAAAAVLFIMRTYAIFVHLSWGVVLHRPIFNHLDEVRNWLVDHDEDVLPP